jgi:hypothetical protein
LPLAGFDSTADKITPIRSCLEREGKALAYPVHAEANGVTTDPLIVDFLSTLPEPFPDPKGISAQIQDAVDPNQLLVALKTATRSSSASERISILI